MGAEIEIQRGLYSALTAAGLRVYDSAPQASDGGSTATYPHVEIGHIIVNDWDTTTRLGFDFTARIHTRSRSAGMAEAKGIQGAIYNTLHWQTITISGYNPVLLRRIMSDVQRSGDGSFHGVCEYRGLIEKA